MKLLKIDEQGFFIEDVIVNEIPMISDEEGNQIPDPQYIQTTAQGGFYRPKWDGEKWVEGKTQAEIDEIINTPKEPTKDEIIEQLLDNTETKVITIEETIDILFGGAV